jgi:hypothetical protein
VSHRQCRIGNRGAGAVDDDSLYSRSMRHLLPPCRLFSMSGADRYSVRRSVAVYEQRSAYERHRVLQADLLPGTPRSVRYVQIPRSTT